MEDFTNITICEQKIYNGVPFPLVLSPAFEGSSNLAQLVEKNKKWVENQLLVSGAVLFRGFDVSSASEFNQVLQSFNYKDASFIASGAPRTHVVGKVFTSNDGPPNMRFYSHNEMAYIKDHPMKAFFYCEIEPGSGGETPIAHGHILYQKMMQHYPNFVDEMERKGLVYTRGMSDGNDPTSMIGRGWQAIFGTDDKDVAELKAAELGWTLEWIEGGGVKASMPPVPGYKVVEMPNGRTRKVWFNSLAAAYKTWSDSRNKPGTGVCLADGTPLQKEAMDGYFRILEEESVAFGWRKGDVLMLDNYQVQHARNAFTPPRRVLAAFTG